MESVQSHQRTTTPRDFSNSLIPFFSPRWSDRTESFGNDRNVGSELAGAAKGTEGSFPKVSNSQCKNSGTATWSERSIQMRLFLMHEKPEQWNNWSGVKLFCRTIWSFSRSWEQHKSVMCCEEFLFWANSAACKNLSTLFSPSKASAGVLLPVCDHCPSKNDVNQR